MTHCPHCLEDLNMPVKEEREAITATEIIQVVNDYFKSDVLHRPKDRHRVKVYPRQMAMYMLRIKTNLTQTEVGEFFADKDHTTVSHAVKNIDNLKAAYPEVANDIYLLSKKIK